MHLKKNDKKFYLYNIPFNLVIPESMFNYKI